MGQYADIAGEVFTNEIENLQRVFNNISGEFDNCVELILATEGKVVVTGVGKSGLIGHKLAATFSSTGTPAVFMNAAEALHGDLGLVSPGDVVLMISSSAETLELVKMLPSLQRIGVKLIGLFGKVDTLLAKRSDILLDCSILKESCPLNLAPMTSSTVVLVLGNALAAALIRARGFTREDFAIYHPGGNLGMRLLLRASDVMHSGENLPYTGPGTPLKEILLEMTRYNLGAICVCDKSLKLLGIISEGDLRRHFIKSEKFDVTAEEIMTRNPLSVDSDMLLGDVLDVMENKGRRIYVLPVVTRSGILEGLLRMHDIVSGQA